ncbi:MAG: MopE-related protein [Myxococcota bacterium]
MSRASAATLSICFLSLFSGCASGNSDTDVARPDANAPDGVGPDAGNDATSDGRPVCGIEQCNGTDDDCDGTVDEGCDCVSGSTRGCGSDIGRCTAGEQRCTDGRWLECVGATQAAIEACDGVEDDDCDGFVDEGCECTNGTMRACGTDVGTCSAGVERCEGGRFGTCTGAQGPVPEICDGAADDDCDGAVDEGCTCTLGAIRTCGSSVGACRAGEQRCSASGWGSCDGGTAPTAEECDGVADDDCDGIVDEGCECTNGSTRACGSQIGACVAGTQTCIMGRFGACTGAVGPSVERCDGVADDDCDGIVDEGCACTNGTTRTCGSDVGSCRAGIQRCTSGRFESCTGSVGPSGEVCDGTVDEDCDGMVDESCTCTNGETRSCGSDVGACVSGTETCAGGNWASCTGATGPTTEACDGSVDDDCDGVIDEGCECTSGTVRQCGADIGACMAGSQTCATGFWSVCTGGTGPTPELCDGTIDDDCDGTVDEGCGCVNGETRPCGSSVGACEQGTETCGSGRWGSCSGAVSPTAEVCGDAIDDDCDGMVDEGCDCRTSGCGIGYCEPTTGACGTGLPSYQSQYLPQVVAPLSVSRVGSRSYAGTQLPNVSWAEGATTGNETVAYDYGLFALKGISIVDRGTAVDYAAALYRSSGRRTEIHIGSRDGAGVFRSRSVVDLGVRSAVTVAAKADGSDLYVVGVERTGLVHPARLVIERPSGVTSVPLPDVSGDQWFSSTVLHVSGGRIKLLLVGNTFSAVSSSRALNAHLVDWDPSAAAYRHRSWTLGTHGSGGALIGAGAFDRNGVPVVAVRRSLTSSGTGDHRLATLALHRFDGTGWASTALPDRARLGQDIALTFNRGNRALVGLVNATGAIEYVRENAPGTWSTTILGNATYAARAPSPPTYATFTGMEMLLDDRDRPVFLFATSSSFGTPSVAGTYVVSPAP